MSAYMLDKADIDKIMLVVKSGPADVMDWIPTANDSDLGEIGDALIRENLSSIHYRYPDCETDPSNTPGPCEQYWIKPYIFNGATSHPTRDEAVGLIRSYIYQSCEHPEWAASHANVIANTLLNLLKVSKVIVKPAPVREPVIQYSITETAAAIRAELRKAFPETKFSIRSKSYSMGSSVTIRYVDGPPEKAVCAITDKFSGKSFDGMDDSTHYHSTEYNGKLVQFSGYSPHVSREFSASDDVYAQAEKILKERIDYSQANSYSQSRDDAYRVLRHWDARWETIPRAVERWMAEGFQRM